MELEKGKLYQVYHWEQGWIIAEYIGYHGPMKGKELFSGKPTTVSARHMWRFVHSGSQFAIDAKGMQTRACSAESLSKIESVKADIERLGKERQSRLNELRELCA